MPNLPDNHDGNGPSPPESVNRHEVAQAVDGGRQTADAPPAASRSEAQRRASIENGRKSRGPITPMGKANSANARVTHGLTATKAVLRTEDQAQYDHFRQVMLTELAPANHTEHLLVERIVSTEWRIRRAIREETALLDLELDRTRDEFNRIFTQSDDDTRTVYATESLCNHPTLAQITRHESRLVGQFDRALRALERLRNPKNPLQTIPAIQPGRTIPGPQLANPAQTDPDLSDPGTAEPPPAESAVSEAHASASALPPDPRNPSNPGVTEPQCASMRTIHPRNPDPAPATKTHNDPGEVIENTSQAPNQNPTNPAASATEPQCVSMRTTALPNPANPEVTETRTLVSVPSSPHPSNPNSTDPPLSGSQPQPRNPSTSGASEPQHVSQRTTDPRHPDTATLATFLIDQLHKHPAARPMVLDILRHLAARESATPEAA